MRTLLLVGGTEKYHDVVGAGRAMATALSEAGIGVRLSQDFSALADGRADDYDVVVTYTMSKWMSPKEQAGLVRFVREGKGFVPLHASNVLDLEGHETYAELVGSRFVSHPPFCRFKVQLDDDHPIAQGINDFEIDDELYITEWIGDPGRVLATAAFEGKQHPIAYVKEPGAGRLCYIALGHDGRAWHHPDFRRLLVQGVRWAASR